jgi:cyclopropane fatty-acyl-phospholipid synthase-like methyltransferase
MSFLNRIGLGSARAPATSGAAVLQSHPPATVTAMAKPSFSPRETRGSNSLKDFLWHLNGLGRGNLLDLGPVWQSTVTFFIERGFKVSTEDVLTGWKQFSQDEADRQRALPDDAVRMTRVELANVFLETSLQFAPGSFDAVLAWDVLDYLEDDVMQRLADRLRSIVREGGVILAMFHSKRPQQFQRYRIMDEKTLEMVLSPSIFPMARVFQNREISDLFSKFHTSKTYLGRDQLREGLFVK